MFFGRSIVSSPLVNNLALLSLVCDSLSSSGYPFARNNPNSRVYKALLTTIRVTTQQPAEISINKHRFGNLYQEGTR